MVWAEILAGFFIFVIVVLVLIIMVIANKKEIKLDVKPNSTIFFNVARADCTNGYVTGIVKDRVKCKNGCDRIDFFPTDRKEGEGTKRPAMQSVVYHRANLIPTSTGDFSQRREILWGLGHDITDIPRGLLKSSLGKFMEKESQLSFLMNIFGTRLKTTMQAISTMIAEGTDVELSQKQLANLREIATELEKLKLQTIREEKREEKK